jgi:hypothetical protein
VSSSFDFDLTAPGLLHLERATLEGCTNGVIRQDSKQHRTAKANSKANADSKPLNTNPNARLQHPHSPPTPPPACSSNTSDQTPAPAASRHPAANPP